MALLCGLLAGCGGGGDTGVSTDPVGAGPGGDGPEIGFLGSLNGASLQEVAGSAVKILSRHPSLQNRAKLARELDQQWKINCEQRCQISERN